MRRAALLPVLATGCLVNCSSAAGAIPIADTRGAGDVVLSGDSPVVGSGKRSGGWRVHMPGGPVLLDRSAPRGKEAGGVRLAASSQRIAALVWLEDSVGDLRETLVYSGVPSGPLKPMLRVVHRRLSDWLPLEILVDGPDLLLFEIRRDLGASPNTPLRSRRPTEIGATWQRWLSGRVRGRAGGIYVFGKGRPQRVVAVNLVTGHEDAAIVLQGSEDLEDRDADLGPGGRLVAAPDGRLYTAAPGVAQRRLGRRGQSLTKPRFAGENIVALLDGRFDARRPVLLDPRTGLIRVLGAPSTDLEMVDAGPRVAAWKANRCVFAAPLTAPSGPIPGPARCPSSEVTLDEDDQVLRGRRLRVVVTCIEAKVACRGTVVLRWDGIVARGAFRIRAHRHRRVAVTFPAGAPGACGARSVAMVTPSYT